MRALVGVLVGAVLATGAVAIAVAPPPASAQIAFKACDDDLSLFLPDVECGTTEVASAPPAGDAGGASRPAARLFVRRLRAQRGPRLGTLFVLSGGPGQSSASVLGDFALQLGVASGRYDIIGVDQRGTGGSEALDCLPLAKAPLFGAGFDRAVATCARRFGADRALYSTSTSVADLDAVRAELGVDKISLLGVSYGTKLALAYAATHPDHTRSLVLDSVDPLDAPGPLDARDPAAVREVMTALCRQAACRRELGPRPVDAIARLLDRLDRHPARVVTRNGGGRPVTTLVDARRVALTIGEADLDSWIFEQLPGAMASFARGDRVPLARLVASAVSGLTNAPNPRDFSLGDNLAVNCEDAATVWARGAPIAGRAAALAAAARAVPAAVRSPFPIRTFRDLSLASSCLAWPETARRPLAERLGPLPDVPALLLDGSFDLRTPAAGARAIAAQLPRSELAVFRGQGHSLITADLTACSVALAQRFLEQGSAGSQRCARRQTPPTVRPVVPASLAATAPVPRIAGTRGRVAGAAYRTLRDSFERLASAPSDVLRRGGLRGGIFRGEAIRNRFPREELPDAAAIRRFLQDVRYNLDLDGVTLVPGVRVSGTATSAFPGGAFSADVRVSGAMTGKLTFDGVMARNGVDRLRVSGRLAGRRVAGVIRGRAA